MSIQQNRLLTVSILFLIDSLSGFSQKALTLKDCVNLGMDQHPNVKAGVNNVESARQRVREGYAMYLPQISGNFSLDNNLKLQTNVIPAGIFGPEPIQVRFGQRFNNNIVGQVDQKIYDQSMITGFAAFKPSKEVAVDQLNQTKDDVTYNIASSYLRVLVTKEQLELLKNNQNTYSRILKITELQKEKGVIRQVDLDRITVASNNINSQIAVAENALKLSENNLKVAIGLSPDENITLTDSAESLVKSENVSASPNFDASKRAEYRILEKSVLLQKVVWKQIKSGYVPTLSAYGRYGALALNDKFNDVWKKWYDFSAIGLRVNIPIFDGFLKDSRARQQKIVVKNQELTFEYAKLQFKLQYQNALTQLERNKINLRNDRANMNLAKNVFEQTSLLYEKGTASLSDFLNAENAYKEAQINFINSLLNLKQAELDLHKADGTIQQFISQ
jgi:outer membrane protein TolC